MNRFLTKASERFADWDARFQEYSLRERTLLSVGAIAILFLVCDSLFLRPAVDELERIDRLGTAAREEIASLEADLAGFGEAELTPEEERLLERRRRIEAELAAIDRDIAGQISDLVPPESVVSVLERMLEHDPRLRLVQIRSQAPHHVGSRAPESDAPQEQAATTRLYRHGLRVEVEGDFAAILDYLERVESAPWHLLWDRFEYRVERHPTARITIDLHTISEQEEWIGV